MNFDSLRHQISHFVHESREPLTIARLREICDLAENDKQLANAIYNMAKAGELSKHLAPEGSGEGVRWLYGPGKVKPGAETPKTGAGGGRPKSREIGRAGDREIEAAREETQQAEAAQSAA